jgi:surface carbohydrate biosynthesis protein (TIGR04326 family)
LFKINFRKIYRSHNINVTQFLYNDWIVSFFGTLAIHNHIQIHTFNKYFKKIPRQKIGFYLYENQGYEYIINHFWKKHNHQNLVAVSHTTIRFWDLRYFQDKTIFKERTFTNNLPDLIALNSPISKEYFKNIEILKNKIIELEALRYFHLLDTPQRYLDNKSLNILVCCDILENVTYKMLDWVNYIIENTSRDIKVIVKPHPACPANLNEYTRNNKILICFDQISELLSESNFVFVSNSSSSSIDAYCRNIFVVQMIDGNTLNLSPLREVKNSLFASNKQQLLKLVESYNFNNIFNKQDYFYLDINYPKWKKLLIKYAK